MFRRPFRVISVKPLLRPTRSCKAYGNRHTSTGPRGGGRKFLVSLVGATTLGIGGTIAYASYDSDFRKQLNQTIPFSEDILTPLIGAPDGSSSEPTKSPLPDKNVNKSEESLMKKRLDRSRIKLDQETSKAISSNPSSSSLSTQTTSVPPPPLDIPESSEKKSAKVEKTVKHEGKKEVKIAEPTKVEKPVGVVVPTSVKNESTDKKPSINTSSKLEDEKIVKNNLTPMKDMNSDITDELTSNLAQQYSKIEDLEADFEKKIDMIRDEYERELMKQLKRQVAVYLDHLNDQLEVQRAEMERIQRLTEEDKILAVKDRFYSELSGALNKLSEIESVLAVRQKLEEEDIGARKLWLLCQSLKDSLKSNGLKEPTPVKEEINSMKQTVEGLSVKSPMTSILNSIPKKVIEEGVHNEDSLIERFHKVDKICKRVALIGDDGGSLYQYFLSYLQSMLLIDAVKIPEQELAGTVQVDPSKWDTFEILARVRYCLGQRNIEQALRYANQLRGAPRKVAKDWIIDTRTHLEVRQATELLQALAATITIRAVK